MASGAIIRRMRMGRLGLAVLSAGWGAMLCTACTVEGKEIESSFSDPTTNPNGPPPSTNGDSGSETEGESSGGSGGSAGSGSTSTAVTTTATTSATASDSTGAPADEQPEDGMYAECMGVASCIGLNTCVTAGTTGFCSNTNCIDPTAQCDPNPGATSTAPPACVDNGMAQMVCALSCAGGQTCPGGMECVVLGATMVCA